MPPTEPALHRIVVLNPKGGSGKTTIATNLAAYYATQGRRPALMDLDPQGSSMRWLRKRPREAVPIHGISEHERDPRVTKSFAMRIPQGTERVIVDTPAALSRLQMPEVTRGAGTILVPVLPSEIDIHAAARCIADLLLIAKVHRSERRLAIVANRVKRQTVAYRSLMRFLGSLRIPVVAALRDSQNYLRAAESGQGLHEMKSAMVEDDLASWQPLIAWIEYRETRRPNPVAESEQSPDANAAES